jgi:hypothetical protein
MSDTDDVRPSSRYSAAYTRALLSHGGRKGNVAVNSTGRTDLAAEPIHRRSTYPSVVCRAATCCAAAHVRLYRRSKPSLCGGLWQSIFTARSSNLDGLDLLYTVRSLRALACVRLDAFCPDGSCVLHTTTKPRGSKT